MYLIFDLDDTILNTTRTLGRKQLAKVAALLRDGDNRLSEAQVYEQLLQLRENFCTGREAIVAVCSEFHIEDRLLEQALHVYYHQVNPAGIEAMPGAAALLDELAGSSKLALVSIGKRDTQLAKMVVAGINAQLFHPCIITEADKGRAYLEVASAWHLSGAALADVIVIGDRYATDIEPAQRIGFRTIMVGQRPALVAPDLRVAAMDELGQALRTLQKGSTGYNN